MFKTCYGSEQFPLTFKKKRQTFIYLNSKFSSGYSRSQLYLKGFSHYPVRGQISFLGIKQKLKYLCLKQCRLNSWRVSKCLPFLSQVNTSPYHVKVRYTQRKRLLILGNGADKSSLRIYQFSNTKNFQVNIYVTYIPFCVLVNKY